MELLSLLSSPIFYSLLLLFIAMASNLIRNESKSRNSKLPPGPWKLPLIGNLHQMIGALPHHTLRRLSNKYGPLMHLQLGEVSTVVISSPEMAMQVMKKHDATFASRPHMLAAGIITYNYTNIAFAPYGAYWRELRKICTTRLLNAGRVKSFRYIREQEVSDFIRTISLNAAGKPVNLTEKIFSLGIGIISRAAFGKKNEEWCPFISIMKEIIELGAGFCVADFYPSIRFLQGVTGMKGRLEDLHQRADKILESIVNEHKMRSKSTRTSSGEATEDLVDVLLEYTDDEATTEFRLTIENIKSVISDIFAGGSDTSSATVEWAMSEMIRNPSVMAKAQAEVRQVFDAKGKVDETDIHALHYLKLVIKEVLRLHTVVPLLVPRECGDKCEINGYEIPQKTKVIVNAWAIGRDPNYWNDPDTFNPERFKDSSTDYKGTSFEFIPFGAGRRICPGILFGTASIELILAELLYHFDWKLPDGLKHDKLDMTPNFGVVVKRKQNLVLVPSIHPKSSAASSVA